MKESILCKFWCDMYEHYLKMNYDAKTASYKADEALKCFKEKCRNELW